MKFNILGHLEVFGDDAAKLEIRQARQRALLIMMLLHANEVVSIGRLADALWGEERSVPGEGALRTHVWALRRFQALGGRLCTAEGGYRLDILPGELDLAEFRDYAGQSRQVLRTGNLSSSEALLRQALRLWREPWLPDMPATAVMEVAARRLLDERQDAQEMLTEVRLALGQHAELIPELRANVAADPMHERLWEHLMLALHRAGRTAEALAAYQRARASITENLGIEPGHGLQLLHRRILDGDPALVPEAVRSGSTAGYGLMS